LVCEGDYDIDSAHFIQSHLVSIHVPTGEVTRIVSRARVFLPTEERPSGRFSDRIGKRALVSERRRKRSG